MPIRLKALAATFIGLAVLLPGTAVAAAAPSFAPLSPKPRCQAADNQLCPPGMDVKAQAPRGYKMPKKPKGY